MFFQAFCNYGHTWAERKSTMKAKLENLCHYSFQLRRSKFWWQRHARTQLQVSVPKNSQYSRHSKLSLLMELDPLHPSIFPLLLYDQGVNMHILWQRQEPPSSTLFLHTQSLRQFTLQLCFFILQFFTPYIDKTLQYLE